MTESHPLNEAHDTGARLPATLFKRDGARSARKEDGRETVW